MARASDFRAEPRKADHERGIMADASRSKQIGRRHRAGMNGKGPDAFVLKQVVHLHRKQNQGCLGLRIGAHSGVFGLLKVDVVKNDATRAVAA